MKTIEVLFFENICMANKNGTKLFALTSIRHTKTLMHLLQKKNLIFRPLFQNYSL